VAPDPDRARARPGQAIFLGASLAAVLATVLTGRLTGDPAFYALAAVAGIACAGLAAVWARVAARVPIPPLCVGLTGLYGVAYGLLLPSEARPVNAWVVVPARAPMVVLGGCLLIGALIASVLQRRGHH
jgi:hypothetical protein